MTFDWSRNLSFICSIIHIPLFFRIFTLSQIFKISIYLIHKQLRLSLIFFLNHLFSTLSSNISRCLCTCIYIWLKWYYHTHWSLLTNCREHCYCTGGSQPLLGKVPSIDSLFIVYFMKKNLIPFNYVITSPPNILLIIINL